MSSRGEAARQASDFVQLLREFLQAYAALRGVFGGATPEDLGFETLARVVGDDDGSVLYRLKQRSHALFRSEAFASPTVRHEALFDLTVGSLFHEAMTLRESLYQRDVYQPRIASLRAASGDDPDPLFGEFERLLAKSGDRLEEVVAEVRILLAQTRDQFRRVLVERAGERGVTRCLLRMREQVDAAFPEGFDGLLEAMHGDVATGLIEAARSFLESAYFVEAARALREAERVSRAPRGEIGQLVRYADGMQAFLDTDYPRSLAALEAWADLRGPDEERELARRAVAVLGRVERLVGNEPGDARVVDAAKQLQLRLEASTG